MCNILTLSHQKCKTNYYLLSMKTIIFFLILSSFIICALATNINITLQNKSSQNLKWGQIEALARGENPENAKYNKIKGDCSKSFSVDANGYVTIRGKKIKVGGGGGTYSAHYTDVQIDCPVGSMYVTCSECSCSAFWDNKC